MALINKALRLQALLITLVALTCIIEDGVNAIFDNVTREIVKDLALAAMSHVAVKADKKTKGAMTHVNATKVMRSACKRSALLMSAMMWCV